jgi:hypothetical protein
MGVRSPETRGRNLLNNVQRPYQTLRVQVGYNLLVGNAGCMYDL